MWSPPTCLDAFMAFLSCHWLPIVFGAFSKKLRFQDIARVFKDLHLLSGWGGLELLYALLMPCLWEIFFGGSFMPKIFIEFWAFGFFTLYFINFLLDLSLLDCTYAVLYHSICLNNNLYTTLWWIIPNITHISCNTENFDSLHFCNFSEQVKRKGQIESLCLVCLV